MAKASNVTLEIDSSSIPLLPDVIELIGQGMLTRGDKNNRVYVGDTVAIGNSVSREMQSALFDPQTAGGLLISIDPVSADEFLDSIGNAHVIGRVSKMSGHLINVS
jgi:selenide,water dikinase